jgi:hypothetical protein
MGTLGACAWVCVQLWQMPEILIEFEEPTSNARQGHFLQMAHSKGTAAIPLLSNRLIKVITLLDCLLG